MRNKRQAFQYDDQPLVNPYLKRNGYTGVQHANGYRRIRVEVCEGAANGYKSEHTLVAERALGHRLPKHAVIHHVDGNRSNNSPKNLVICEDRSYHQLLHQRQRIIDQGGNPDIQKRCSCCREMKLRAEFQKKCLSSDGLQQECRQCKSDNQKRRNRMNSTKANLKGLLPDIEIVSAKVHEAWMETKLAKGVTSRKLESGEELMVPYAELTEEAKDLDRSTVVAVYKAIEAAA